MTCLDFTAPNVGHRNVDQPRPCSRGWWLLLILLCCLLTETTQAQTARRYAAVNRDPEPEPRKLLHSSDTALQLDWATRYEHGEGVDKDLTLAIKLYCRAGWKGVMDAQYRLGWIYANGRGADRDDGLAARWFKLAADQGDTYAQRMLRQVGGPPADKQTPRCKLPGLKRAVGPIQSVPDPSPALIAEWVEQLAPEYDLEPTLVIAVIRAESNFNPRALSPKNAQGLMQLIPGTARRFGVKDVWDPVDNLRGGMAYLSWLLDHFKGEVSLALAGYNAGEGAVLQYRGIPPYPETRGYVKRVKAYMRKSLAELTERGA
ncbi:MAG: transglycosylase SLT domain-containing protein [Gammaproteobacteria bacterium]|nr:transglycosylase SLT domain-containing protein [Gammaproteobacteria bacterium]